MVTLGERHRYKRSSMVSPKQRLHGTRFPRTFLGCFEDRHIHRELQGESVGFVWDPQVTALQRSHVVE